MTDVLNYRLLSTDDAGLLFSFNSSIENLEFVPRTPFRTMDEADLLLAKFLQSMKENSAVWWTFHDNKTGNSVGYGGLFGIDKNNSNAEIGYGFLKEYWGKGYASYVVDFITKYGFSTLKLHRIYGLVDPENKASIRVLEKNEYNKEGVMHDYYYVRGRYFDMCLLAKINK